MTEPLAFSWTGHELVPLHRGAASRVFKTDEIYWMAEVKLTQPSGKSWRHLWALLQTAWLSLPEDLKDTYPTPDALRKRALISSGFYDETIIEVGDQATAGRIATSLRRVNDVAHVIVSGGNVFQRTAKSMKDMDKDEFERAKQAVIETIADLIGITVDELTKEGHS